MTTRGTRRTLVAAGLCAALAATAACGIRPTKGPVSAGPAAVRPSAPATASGSQGVETHEIFLVHDGLVQSVARSGAADLRPQAPLSSGAFTALADRLLRELAVGPTVDESGVGWTTAVPAGAVHVVPALGGDPAGTVRLDVLPASLDRLALGQVVCTVQAASHSESVELAGRRNPPENYRCEDFLKPPPAATLPAPTSPPPR